MSGNLSPFLAFPSGSGDSGGRTGSSLTRKSVPGREAGFFLLTAAGRPSSGSGVPSDRRPYTASVIVEYWPLRKKYLWFFTNDLIKNT